MKLIEHPLSDEYTSLMAHGSQRVEDSSAYHSFMLDKDSNLHITSSNSGVSQVGIMLCKIDVDGLIELLQAGKRRLEEHRVVNKLKGK